MKAKLAKVRGEGLDRGDSLGFSPFLFSRERKCRHSHSLSSAWFLLSVFVVVFVFYLLLILKKCSFNFLHIDHNIHDFMLSIFFLCSNFLFFFSYNYNFFVYFFLFSQKKT